MKERMLRVGIVRALVAAGVVAASGLISQTALAEEPIKIGWLSSLTGPLSSAAVAENQGVQFAVEEINKAGGIDGRQIELLTRDTAGDPTKAVNFAQQLLFRDKVNFIIGPVNSGESLATGPIAAKAGIPNIVIGSIDELTDRKSSRWRSARSTRTPSGSRRPTITRSTSSSARRWR